MAGQMCWLASSGSNEAKILHLRTRPQDPWQPYTRFPFLAVADYPMPKGSKGWATYQKLFKAGWLLISTAEAEQSPALAEALLQR